MSCLVALLFLAGTILAMATVLVAVFGTLVPALITGFCSATAFGIAMGLSLKVQERGSSGSLRKLCIAGLVLEFVAIVVWVPFLLKWRTDARRSSCISNMRLLDHAKEVLATKNHWTNGYVIADSPEGIWKVLSEYVDGTNRLVCPEAPNLHYVYGAIDETPKCPVADRYPEHVYNAR